MAGRPKALKTAFLWIEMLLWKSGVVSPARIVSRAASIPSRPLRDEEPRLAVVWLARVQMDPSTYAVFHPHPPGVEHR